MGVALSDAIATSGAMYRSVPQLPWGYARDAHDVDQLERMAATRLRQMRKAHENGTAEAAPPPAQCSCAVS